MTPGISTGPQRQSFTRRWLLTTDHRQIGLLYLGLALLSVTLGALLSLVMRLHLAWPDRVLPLHGPILPEDYLALVTIHGTLMLFFVLTTAPQSGFGNLLLPSQIGARTMAFPVLNALSFWTVALALAVLLSAFFVPGGSPISGWTAYPPLSAIPAAGPGQGSGMDLWLLSISLFSIGTAMSGLNTLVTVFRLRGPGMTWTRLPLTVWAWLTAAFLSVLAYSVLLAALLLLFCDRHAGTTFFIPTQDFVNGVLAPTSQSHGGSPLLWLHLFWFFGHPEVYIAVLPGLGLTSTLLSNFTHRRIFAYRTMIVTTLAIGGLGIIVWGHHMFVAGLNPFAGTAFSLSTMAIAIPSIAKVLSWIATVWRSHPRLTPPMLFALGFVSFFITGGITGPVLAQPILDQYLHSSFFVVAHFHLIMAMAGVFGLFAATYYWFPLVTGRLLNDRLGRLHFWGTLFFAYNTFLPMYLTGISGQPRHYAQLSGIANAAGHLLELVVPLNRHISASAFLLAAFQLVFLANLLFSIRRGQVAGENPWQATTLEWAPGLWAGAHTDDPLPVVFREPGHYDQTNDLPMPQWQPFFAAPLPPTLSPKEE